METAKHTFVVTVEAPAGVGMAEVADHLADASRLVADGYDGSDPMSGLGPIEIMGAFERRKL